MSEPQTELHDTIRCLRASNDELRQTVGDYKTKVLQLEKAYSKTAATNKELERTVDRLSTVVAHISKRVGTEAGDGNAAAAEGASPPTIEQRISKLERNVRQSETRFRNTEHDLQCHIRRNSLKIKNLCPKEDRSIRDIFLVFVNSVLGVSLDVLDIDDVHLLDSNDEASRDKKNHKPRTVLITFTCYRTRTQVYQVHLLSAP